MENDFDAHCEGCLCIIDNMNHGVCSRCWNNLCEERNRLRKTIVCLVDYLSDLQARTGLSGDEVSDWLTAQISKKP